MDQIKNQLATIQTGLAVATSTTQPELTIEERQLRDALEGRKIRFASEEELKQLMLFVYALVGLRGENYPKGLDKDFLHSYIRDYYGGHTVLEIRLAFTMAVQNKLGVDATAFEYFTTAYFSKVVDAYRKWSTETIKTQHSLITPELPEPNTSDEEFIEAVRNLYKIHNDYRQIPVLAYDVLNLGLTSKEKVRVKGLVDKISDESPQVKIDRYKQYAVKEYFDGVEPEL